MGGLLMNLVYGWVKNIVFFLLIISIINNLAGDSNYKKYINLITGMILIILVISPLTNLFNINEKIDYYFAKNSFEVGTEDISNKLIKIEDQQKASIAIEYKKEIEKQTAQLLEKEGLYISYFQVIISEQAEVFGTIEEIDLIAGYTVNEEENISEPIEKVEIDRIEIGENKDYDGASNTSIKEIHIRKLLSDFYNVDVNNINIDIRES